MSAAAANNNGPATVLQFVDPTVRDGAVISSLILNVRKDNYAATVENIEKRSQNLEAFRYMINRLTVEIVTRKDNDQHQLQLLDSQIRRGLDHPAYITMLCDLLDGIPASVPISAVNDLFAKSIRLKPAQLIALSVAICFSSSTEGEVMGKKLLLIRLKEHEKDDLFAVCDGFSQSSVELRQHVLLIATQDAQCQQYVGSLKHDPKAPFALPTTRPTSEVVDGVVGGLSLARLMEELGTPCCATVEDAAALLSIFPGKLSPHCIAECMALFASAGTPNTDASYFKSLLRTTGQEVRAAAASPSMEHLRSWNTTAFVHAVKDAAPTLSWPECISALDYPSCRIDKFTTVGGLYKKATEQLLPVKLFIGRWDNAMVQGAALRWILNNPLLVNPIESSNADLLAAMQPPADLNPQWRSVGFVQSIVHAATLDKDTETCLLQAATRAPAIIFAALMLAAEITPQQVVSYAILILRSAGAAVVSPHLIELCRQEGALNLLLGVLGEFATDPVRVNEAMDCLANNNLLELIFKVAKNPKTAAHAAIKGVSAEKLPANWFNVLNDEQSTKEWPFSRYAFAASIVEVCDELLSQTPPQISEGTTAALTAVSTCSFANVLVSVAAYAKTLLTSGTNAEHAPPSITPELEKEATEFLKNMYASDGSDHILDKAILLYSSPKKTDKELCQGVVHVLWEEAVCITQYPKKVLTIAARLFGKFINAKDLLPSQRLQSGLRIVLQALMKPADGKVLEFGIQALEQFKSRVTEWPQYCNALKGIPDLDMHVPGIMATINSANKAANAQAARKGSPLPTASSPTTSGTTGTSSSGTGPGSMHQHDIRILMGREGSIAPPEVVQNRINFLVGNTDPSNYQTTASELRELLKPEYFLNFAEYLVVKRVSLEANHHRMYLQLIEAIEQPGLLPRIRQATYDAIRRLLSSDRIRANSSERTLLKNLGSWLGTVTLAQNIPVLARDLDFKELLYDGLRNGKLIAVVPLIAKIIEQAPHSRIFKPPNPWVMSQLGHLMELYQLPDLKMTLRFEIEVLCKNISVNFQEVPETSRLYHHTVSMMEIRRSLDISNSTDFRAEEPQHSHSGSGSSPIPDPDAGSSKLKPTARPYLPREDTPVSSPAQQIPSPRPPPTAPTVIPPPHKIVINAESVKFGQDLSLLSANIRAPYRENLPGIIEKATAELGVFLDRNVVIAVGTAREVVVKDFTRDPDDLRLRRASQQMVRSLSTSLCSATIKDQVRGVLRKALPAGLAHYFTDQQSLEAAVDHVIQENVDLVVSFAVAETADRASARMEELLAPVLEERANAKRDGTFPVLSADQQRALPILSQMGDNLRPTSLSRTHLQVYAEFSPNEENAVEEVLLLLQQIEEAARRHYDLPGAVPLSLTSSSFTELNHSEHHSTIKNKLLEVAHLISESNALALATTVFPKLMKLAEAFAANQRNPLNSLLNEVCLFVLQSSRERNQAKIVLELTKLYLGHPKCWTAREVATNFLRLRLMDISEFDRSLAQALRDEQANGGTNRSTVEFAGHVVQRCLIDDKLTSAKEMKQTLSTLEEIAKARKAAQAKTNSLPMGGLSQALRTATCVRIPTLHSTEHRNQVKPLFAEWTKICLQRNEGASTAGAGADASPSRSATQQASMAFVQKLQTEGFLKPDGGMLDKFLGICVDLAVEEYSTAALLLVRNGGDPSSQAALNVGIQQEGKVVQPPAFRFRSDPKLFAAVDAVSDLVVLLARCCGWNAGTRNDTTGANKANVQAESALITKVLHVASKVLQHNHDYFIAQQRPQPPQLTQGEALQDEFQQQPYVRLISNVLIALNPPTQAGADANQSPPMDNIHIIASTLHMNNPQRVPGFAFGWLELISHRVFVSRILKNHAGWYSYSRVYCDALRFMEPFLSSKGEPLNSTFLLFFKSVLKLSLVLLHDFSDFIMTYHQPLCDAIPSQCIQLRNVILSAFPRSTRLPDPFGVNFKLDQMPEVTQSPPLADCVRDYLNASNSVVSKEEVQRFISSKTPANFAETLTQKLKTANGGWDVVMLNNVVLTAALAALEKMALERNTSVVDTNAAVLFRAMSGLMDNQGRYHLFSAFTNQLRYPNNHTHFFSSMMLHLFEYEQAAQEVVQEQITRTLVERVLVTRPHPWGLLITFIELVRNNRYNFWAKPFIHCTPGIEQTFEQVGRSIKTSAGQPGQPQ